MMGDGHETAASSGVRTGAGALAGAGALTDIAAFRAGLKPVLKLEGGAGEVGPSLGGLGEELFVRDRVRTDGGWERFVSRDAALVDEAASLTEESEREEDPGKTEAIIARVGVLLGYPACCAEAFAAAPPILRDNNEWLRVARRLEAPETLPREAHPALTGYVPCALTCEATRALVGRLRDAAPPPFPLDWLDYPTLLLLDRPGEIVFLRPRSAVGDGFSYEIAFARSDDPRVAALAQGDRLEVGAETIRALSTREEAREVARFEGDAFLWWTGGVWHREAWRERLARQLARRSPMDVAETAEEDEAPQGPPPDPGRERRKALRAVLERALPLVEAHPKRLLRGYTVEAVDDRAEGGGWGQIVVTLTRGGERIDLHLHPREAVERPFAATERYAAVHGNQETSPDEARALDVVLRTLERVTRG